MASPGAGALPASANRLLLVPRSDVDDSPRRGRSDEWAVWLPHDCDEWTIAAGPAEHVATQVRLLIDSLTEALAVVEGSET